MSFYIELSSFLDFILEKDGSSNKENHEIEMAHHIITSISEENINCSASEICHQVRECQINGYESITIQQIYYWWSIESHKIYCRHSDPLLSTKILLEESNLEIIVNSLDSSLPALGFLTTLFDRLIYNKFDAIVIDTTYGTNNLSWELYAIMGVIDGTGFPLSYLLISAGKNRNITEILTYWMQALKERNLRYFPFILTDKDFSEINASKTVWPEAHLQLYLRKTVIKLVENHSSRHMLLPKSNGTFIIDANEIWKECISEMFQFCKNNNLLQLWIYLWKDPELIIYVTFSLKKFLFNNYIGFNYFNKVAIQYHGGKSLKKNGSNMKKKK
uniref:MULE transposase domain-containing protein n=1 Tax=Rhizophagus irregularis (strain DAOM 181602 / DAOM 197198 / MUCL 43194) TaxID=747089 RepID=U9TKF2_RHIID